MRDSEAVRKKRADERPKTMKIRFTTLDDETDPWPVYGVEGVSLAWQLSKQAWELSGRPFPKYRRSEMPIRFVKLDSK